MPHRLTAYEAAVAFYDFFFPGTEKLSLRDYLDNSFCDEMAEIDLKHNRCELLYHVENKYVSPSRIANFDELYAFAHDFVVHPEDRHIFADLMDPKTILQKLHDAKHPDFRFAHFRYKLKDGRYRTIEQAVIAGPRYGLPENVARLYIFDVQNVVSRQQGLATTESEITDESLDEATGLYLDKAFFKKAQDRIDQGDEGLCFLALDIEHFKLFDEWYGRERGDFLIARFGVCAKEFADKHGGLGGYLGADDFVLLGNYTSEMVEELYQALRGITLSFGDSVGFVPAIGVYHVSRGDIVMDAYDRASNAANRAKHDFRNHIHVYDPQIQLQSEEDYRLLLDFMKGFREGEITFYLQPQCRISTRQIVGAEALCRWRKSDGTFVRPDRFIPVLEKYGFVTDLDQYLWEKVVQSIKDFVDRGHRAVPISINISRVDIFAIDVAQVLLNLCHKYSVSPEFIKVEITESAYAENADTVLNLVEKLRASGFLVLMDDFGSGYSSLNMLGTINVDAIKLDAMFLNSAEKDHTRGIHIIESIVSMAKNLSLPIIVEGAESKNQVDFLESLGCRYVQGYYFYKPMSKREFEELIGDGKLIDGRGFVAKNNEEFRLREFLDASVYSDAMLNKILGPVGIYIWKDERVDIVRYNQLFYEAVNVPDFVERLVHIERFVPEADLPVLYRILKEAKENPLNGSVGYVHFYKTDGTLTTFLMQFYYLNETPEGSRLYCSARNVTELADMKEQMSIISGTISDSILFMRRRNDKWEFEVIAHGLNNVTGIEKEQLQKELDDGSFWKRVSKENIQKLLSYVTDSFEKREGFESEVTFKNAKGKEITLYLTADSAAGRASNVDYVITFHRKKIS